MMRTTTMMLVTALLLAMLAALAGCGDDNDGDPADPNVPHQNTALFHEPMGITTDGTYLYVADTFNHTIRKVTAATGATVTLAGAAGVDGSSDGTGAAASFNQPRSITLLGGQLYVADSINNTIRQVDPGSGAVTTLAGAAGVAGGDDGAGAAASFHFPNAIGTDGTDLYVADTYASTVRKVTTAGVVTTVAGLLHQHGATDGVGENARFRHPSGIAVHDGYAYVSDTGNYTVRRIELATRTVTTWVGSAGDPGTADGAGSAARFDQLYGLDTDGTTLFIADAYGYTVRQAVLATAVVTTLAGLGGTSGSTDGVGDEARLYLPKSVVKLGGDLYIADSLNHAIRALDLATRQVTLLVGTPGTIGTTD